ncbi:MAG: class I SAM-dependent methyltransferase [Rhizobiaceae bacterium]
MFTEAEDIEYKAVEGTFSFYQCLECDSVSVSPVLSNRLEDIYPSDYYSFEDQGGGILQTVKQAMDRRAFSRLTARIPGDDLTALDVGGGTGFLLKQLQKADSRVSKGTIVDINAKAESAAVASGFDFFLGGIEQFDSEKRFDVILMVNLIEHVADPGAVLKQAANLLTPNGQILIKTPNYKSLDERIFHRHSWGGYHCPRHFVLFTKESFSNIVSRCGLRVVRASYTQGAPFWSVSVIAWLQKIGVLKRTQKPLYQHFLNAPLMGVFAVFDFLRLPFSKTSQMTFILAKR